MLSTQSPHRKSLASLTTAREKSLGNLLFRSPKPTLLSSQKKTSFPLSTTHLKRSSKVLPQSSNIQISFRSLHQKESMLFNLCSFKRFQPSYFDSRISFHNSPLFRLRHHIHFPNKATFKSLILRIPRLPASRDSQTLS